MFLHLRDNLLVLFLLQLQLFPYAVDLPILKHYKLVQQHIGQYIFGDFEVQDRVIYVQLIGQLRVPRLVAEQEAEVGVDVQDVFVVLDDLAARCFCYLCVENVRGELVQLVFDYQDQDVALSQGRLYALHGGEEGLFGYCWLHAVLALACELSLDPVDRLVVRVQQNGPVLEVIEGLYDLGIAGVFHSEVLKRKHLPILLFML